MMTQIVPGGAFVLALAIVFSYILPTYSGQIKETKAAIERINSALEASRDFATKKDALVSARNTIGDASRVRLEMLLPSSVNSIATIVDLTALAGRSGVQISKIEAEKQTIGAPEAVATEGVGSLDLTLAVVGTYQAFRVFLDAIEHSAQLLDVIDLSIKSSETGVYEYDLRLRLYWLR